MVARALEVDGRVQALAVGLGLASNTYHTNYFTVCTCMATAN